MIPSGLINTELQVEENPETSKTYMMAADKIQGYTDQLEALKQAIYKLLSTEKYEYPIYSFSYGIELDNLLGKDPAYVRIELKRRIRECLLQDERIKSVDNFVFTVTGDEILCAFNVISIYGSLSVEREVNM